MSWRGRHVVDKVVPFKRDTMRHRHNGCSAKHCSEEPVRSVRFECWDDGPVRARHYFQWRAYCRRHLPESAIAAVLENVK